MSYSYELAGKASITFRDAGETVRHEKGDEITPQQYERIPPRQQRFFRRVVAEDVRRERRLSHLV